MDNKYDQLVELQDGEATTTSLQIAKASGKKHKVVLEAIDGIILDLNKELAENSATSEMFKEAYYIHEQNHQKYRMFIINRDGWTMLLGSFNGSKYTLFRYEYMKQFNGMQKQLEQVGLSDQQTNLITAEAHKMQAENERLKELRLAMNQADKLERNDLSERLLEKEVETLVGHQVKHAVPIDHKSQFHLTASKIAERFGISATRVGSVAKLLGMHEGVDRIKVDERWLYTERAVSKMRARLEA